MARKVQFVETVLRDANQSLIATRLPYEKFEPMLETIDKAGFYAAECWGGATFDVCLRYLNEDPWERLRKIRAAVPNTKLQMLLRGQNVLGYSHYPDDFVKLFVKKAVENGIDIIRIFDADGNEVQSYTSEATELNMPMAVLVNGSTASAAELFTSAVRDYDKATIVGTTTYGKGCMQTTIPLSDYSAVSVTYRMYNPPFSDNYHGIGIVPDVEVELDEALLSKNVYKITDEEDNQLAAAAKTFYE